MDHYWYTIFNVWKDFNITDILSALPATCKDFHRLSFSLVQQQGITTISNALKTQYQCQNIRVNSADTLDLLERFIRARPAYQIRRLELKFRDFTQKLVMQQLMWIGDMTKHMSAYDLDLEYSYNWSKAYDPPAYIYPIPQNVKQFTFRLNSGNISIKNPPAALKSITLLGHHLIGVQQLISSCLISLSGVKVVTNLPHSLTTIKFIQLFNSSLDELASLPNLETLHLHPRGEFNFPLNNLPASLKHLRVGGRFSYPVDNLPNLETLHILVPYYKHNLDCLPQTLHTLKITVGDTYPHPFRALPNSLCKLRIQCARASLISGFPKNIVHLTLHFKNPSQMLDWSYPPHLHTLKLKGVANTIQTLPTTIEILDMRKTRFGLEYFFPQIVKHLPSSIISLSLPASFDDLICIPSSNLTFIQFGASFNSSLTFLSDSIEIISFYAEHTEVSQFNQPLVRLPHNLQELRFYCSSEYNQPLPAKLPQGLKVLQFIGHEFAPYNISGKHQKSAMTSRFNQTIDRLSEGIQTLVLGSSFSLPIQSMPKSLCTFVLSYEYPLHHPNPSFPGVTVHYVKYREQSTKKRKRCFRIRSNKITSA